MSVNLLNKALFNRLTLITTLPPLTFRPISRVSVLGKSVLPRVLVRVTLLLPAHLPVLIGLRVTHSWGCVYV